MHTSNARTYPLDNTRPLSRLLRPFTSLGLHGDVCCFFYVVNDYYSTNFFGDDSDADEVEDGHDENGDDDVEKHEHDHLPHVVDQLSAATE